MLQTAGSNMDPGLYKLILADIARLKKMPDLARQIEAYEPQPDPLQQEMQQMELEKTKLSLAKLQAEIMVLAATAKKEGAATAKLQAMVDKMALDFVEQETGVQQARKRELVGAQAQSQMELLKLKGRMELESKLLDALTTHSNLQKKG